MSSPPAVARPTPSAKSLPSGLPQIRVLAISLVAASYGIDGVLLAGYVALGALSWPVVLAYVSVGALQCAFFHQLISRGLTQHLKDPGLATIQTGVGTAVQVAFMQIAPEAFPVFVFACFTLIAFGALQLSMRVNLLIFATLAVAATVSVTMSPSPAKWQPAEGDMSQFLLLACFLTGLLRCSFIGSLGVQIRDRILRRQVRAEESARQLRDLAQKDPLTGALNRRGMQAILEDACHRSLQGGTGFSLAMIDLDHFKRVNDVHGHLVGDEVLRRAAQCIGSALRQMDVMARYGGEEFLVLLHGATEPKDAINAAERVQRALADADWSVLGPELRQTASVGIGIHVPGEPVEDTITRADAALYQGKQEGRNRVRLQTEAAPQPQRVSLTDSAAAKP